MKILLVGGQSALAQVLRPVLDSFAEVLTAGRSGCDVELDLTWSADRFKLPWAGCCDQFGGAFRWTKF